MCLLYSCFKYSRMVGNFRGVQIFVDFVESYPWKITEFELKDESKYTTKL